MTTVAAVIFGVIVAALQGDSGITSLPRVLAGFLIGGLIVGLLEWQTLRLYRISIGPLWCGVTTGMLVLLACIMVTIGDGALFVLPLWGLVLDVPRWLLLRSRCHCRWLRPQPVR